MLDLQTLTTGTTATAISALGTASFAIVDGLKTLPVIGVSNAGYAYIQSGIQTFFPRATRRGAEGTLKLLFDTLHGNWINGRELDDQKSIAKSLIKLQLSPDTAGQFAEATGVDKAKLAIVAAKMLSNTALEESDAGTLGRFDLALTAILDDAYQHADQRYRNWAKLTAGLVAVVLALCGAFAADASNSRPFIGTTDMAFAVLAGLLAAPLAPISKDLASALQAGVKVAQGFRS